MILYHFTSLYHLPKIEADGVIRPTESNFSRTTPNAGPPVVWLTDLPDMGDVSHGLEGSLYDKKQVRIAVNVPAIRWLDWPPALSKMPGDVRDSLIHWGGGMEAAVHWFVLPGRIPASRWGDIHIFPDRPGRMVIRHNPDGSTTLVPAAEALKEALG